MTPAARKWTSLSILAVVAVGGAIWGYLHWRHAQIYVDTEDAYVKGHIVAVASRVPGTLLTVDVEENQPVKAGQVVATLDPKDFDAAVTKAQAALAESEAGLATGEAQIALAKAHAQAAWDQLDLATTEKNRFTALYERDSLPKQTYDQAVTAQSVAQAQRAAALKAVTAAQAGLEVSRKKVDSAKASLDLAQIQRSYCTITAPVDGIVSRKMAEPGVVVAPGQPLCAVVPLGAQDIWIEANYKETQLKRVRPGQKATIVADIDKGHTYTGSVESLSAGTGAVFSLLPPENATGNWVKVVQRLPVRIKLDPGTDPNHRLRLGLTVSVEIDTTSK